MLNLMKKFPSPCGDKLKSLEAMKYANELMVSVPLRG